MTYEFNEFQTKWLEALESGEYKQTTGRLHTTSGGMCCLGVACELAGLPREPDEGGEFYIYGEARDFGYAPDEIVSALNLRGRAGEFPRPIMVGDQAVSSLARANDDGVTFSEIAAFIRSNPTAVFKE